jgi:prepilin-type N-terminal cleavage/methylation domain-containing protein
MNKKGYTLFELIVCVFIGLIFISIIGGPVAKGFMTIPIIYSQGERSGEIVKFSKKGLYFKTWEGELNQGRSPDGSTPLWAFSVTSPDVIEAIIESQEKGERITLVYKEYILVSYRDGETDYIITEIKRK